MSLQSFSCAAFGARESEMAFLLRAFFLVYIGLIATAINVQNVVTGVILAFTLLLIRFGVVNLATIRSELIEERAIMSVLLTRGLASAVLAKTESQQMRLQNSPSK